MYSLFHSEKLKERARLGGVEVNCRVILKWILAGCESVDWIHLVQVRILLNTVMNLQVLCNSK
jgi:hypothetical protein